MRKEKRHARIVGSVIQDRLRTVIRLMADVRTDVESVDETRGPSPWSRVVEAENGLIELRREIRELSGLEN